LYSLNASKSNSSKLKQLNAIPGDNDGSGVEETSSDTLQSTGILLDAILRDACEWVSN